MAARHKASKEPISRGPKKASEEKLTLQMRLIKALAHPTRVAILDLMNAGEWSPNELKAALGEGLSQVSYHVKVLRDLEMIQLTRTEPRRGAVEHFYRAIERAFVPSGVASDIPKVAQRIIGNGILENIDADVTAALESGRFYERDDWHVGWVPADLDEQGCQDAEKLADKFVEDFLKIEVESVNRRAKSKDGGEHILTSAVLLVFGSKDGKMTNVPSWRDGRQKP
ncbi:MAG TPA: metalloregulator ArsR/SmtB family transcription factor [Solirubrobacterales bacterium]|nr:metalloregulator ArsR/SmtB family transcription factor [Solirubrobacterales bacterium]